MFEFNYDENADVLWFENKNRKHGTEVSKGMSSLFFDKFTKEIVGGRIAGFLSKMNEVIREKIFVLTTSDGGDNEIFVGAVLDLRLIKKPEWYNIYEVDLNDPFDDYASPEQKFKQIKHIGGQNV